MSIIVVSAPWYAVHAGAKPGVYRSWAECSLALFPKPQPSIFGKFDSQDQALEFCRTGKRPEKHVQDDHNPAITLQLVVLPLVTATEVGRQQPVSSPHQEAVVEVGVSHQEEPPQQQQQQEQATTDFQWQVFRIIDKKKAHFKRRREDGKMEEAEEERTLLMEGKIVDDSSVRAWLTAAVRGISWGIINKKTRILLKHESNYLHGCIHGQWMQKWAKRHWQKASRDKGTIKHYDLVLRLYQCAQRTQVLSFCDFSAIKDKADGPASPAADDELGDLDIC